MGERPRRSPRAVPLLLYSFATESGLGSCNLQLLLLQPETQRRGRRRRLNTRVCFPRNRSPRQDTRKENGKWKLLFAGSGHLMHPASHNQSPKSTSPAPPVDDAAAAESPAGAERPGPWPVPVLPLPLPLEVGLVPAPAPVPGLLEPGLELGQLGQLGRPEPEPGPEPGPGLPA